MKPEKTCRFLNFLLQPLGMKAIWRFSAFIAFADIVDTTFQSRYSTSENAAFDNLFNAYKEIPLVDPSGATMIVNNPYLGCKSLEEAAIRRDLLFPRNI